MRSTPTAAMANAIFATQSAVLQFGINIFPFLFLERGAPILLADDLCVTHRSRSLMTFGYAGTATSCGETVTATRMPASCQPAACNQHDAHVRAVGTIAAQTRGSLRLRRDHSAAPASAECRRHRSKPNELTTSPYH